MKIYDADSFDPAKHDFVISVYLGSYMMKLINYKRIFFNSTEVLGRNAKCYADVARPKLS